MCDSELYKLIPPSIEKLNAILPSSIEDTHVMSEDGLPHPKLKLMHEVRSEQRVEIETMGTKPNGVRTLQFAVSVLHDHRYE